MILNLSESYLKIHFNKKFTLFLSKSLLYDSNLELLNEFNSFLNYSTFFILENMAVDLALNKPVYFAVLNLLVKYFIKGN